MRLSEAWMYRVKAAQRDLIEACGTVRRIEERFNFGKSTVGRWTNGADPTLMPIEAVVALESECGIPFVTTVLAELQGRRLSDPNEDAAGDVCVMSSHAELLRSAAELTTGMAMAIADGKVTPAEAASIDKVASKMQTAMADMRSALATIKARGGVNASLRLVNED